MSSAACSRTCGALSRTAPTYHTPIRARMITIKGPVAPPRADGNRLPRAQRLIIGVSGAQSLAHAAGDGEECGGFAQTEVAVDGKVVLDHLDNAARPCRHHHDAGGEKDRLGA